MIFKRRSKLDKLNSKYQKLMGEWKKYSTINRALSDQKYAEAEEILNQIKTLE